MSKSKLMILLCFVLVFGGMITQSAADLKKQTQVAKESGYVSYTEIYTCYANVFSNRYQSLDNLIAETKERHEAFTLTIKAQNNVYGVYAYNQDWGIPLNSGRVFNNEEYESSEVFTLSNQESGGIIIGNPIANDLNTYQNMYSVPLEKDFNNHYSVQVYSNVLMDEFIHLNSGTNKISKNKYLYEGLHYVFSMIILLLVYILFWKRNRNLLSVKKLVGYSNFELFSDYFLELICLAVMGFLISLSVFILFHPIFYMTTVYWKLLAESLSRTAIQIASILFLLSAFIMIMIRRETTIQLLRSNTE